MQVHDRLHRHDGDTAVLIAFVLATASLIVWFLSGLHSDNRVLDAVPATASLARDMGVGLVELAWLPVLAIATVVGAAVLIVAVGRAGMRSHPTVAGPPVRELPVTYRRLR